MQQRPHAHEHEKDVRPLHEELTGDPERRELIV
jgi:hypothetical protein